MSRVGLMPVVLPKGVTAQMKGGAMAVKGPKGEISIPIPPDITVVVEAEKIVVQRASDVDEVRARHGLTQRLLKNAVHGVTQKFKRELEIVGIGYRAAKTGDKLTISIGFTKPAEIPLPKGVDVVIEANNTRIIMEGVDKHVLGQLAANIRAIRPPEVYQGKGIRYAGERVRKKAGKAAGAGASGAAGGGK